MAGDRPLVPENCVEEDYLLTLLFEAPLLEAALGQITANNTIISRCLLKADSNTAAPGAGGL